MERWEIEQLIGKYWVGETDLEEENALRDFFKNENDIPPEWKSCQTMMLYFEAEKSTTKAPEESRNGIKTKWFWRKNTRWVAAAAVVVIAIAGTFYGNQDLAVNSNEVTGMTNSNIKNTKEFFIEMKKTVEEGKEDLNVMKRINALGMR
jgi:anti-sigma-K factor RskA